MRCAMKRGAVRSILVVVGASYSCSNSRSAAAEESSADRVSVFTVWVGGNDEAFRQGLRELGYTEGQNIVVEWRFVDGKSERYHDFAMVCEWGMSEKLGPMTFGKKEEEIFLG